MATLKQPFKSETSRLEQAIAEIKKSGEVAPSGCWISSYSVRKPLKDGSIKNFYYYKVTSEEAIFDGKQGKVKHLHLGTDNSPAYKDWCERIDRRNRIQLLGRELSHLKEQSQSLKRLDLPSKGTDHPKDCWRTPNTEEFPILDLVQAVLGPIGLDPTADDLKRVPAMHHFTVTDNCLEQSWRGLGTVFMNPPFSKPLPFLRKLAEEYQAGHIPEAIALLKSGAMSNQGTGAIIEQNAVAACFWKHPRRLSYLNEEGVCVPGADFDSVLVYFGEHPERFEQVFHMHGMVTPIKKYTQS